MKVGSQKRNSEKFVNCSPILTIYMSIFTKVKYGVGARPNSLLSNMTKTSTIETACSRYLFHTHINKYQILKKEGPIFQKLAKDIFGGVSIQRYDSVEMPNFPLSSY